jgi:hypothetical protein
MTPVKYINTYIRAGAARNEGIEIGQSIGSANAREENPSRVLTAQIQRVELSIEVASCEHAEPAMCPPPPPRPRLFCTVGYEETPSTHVNSTIL